MNLIKNLTKFNAKERFFLVGRILGNTQFAPDLVFSGELAKELGLEIPADVFSAMDYHIDWIYAALCQSYSPQETYSNDRKLIKAQQEDVDFIMAFECDNKVHLVFIEAKGVTSWSNKQMRSKAERLQAIFGEGGNSWPGVVPHLVMMSPSRPKEVKSEDWPAWMVPNGHFHWLELAIPQDLQKVTRCNSEAKPDQNGANWMIESR
ncbi:hypothetical protein MD588_25245 [Photobacterium sp. SDRW27]|uniref:hypothetical protein n=1 Tax=Photobacterium obscurum TaxID=2829490 RepID=UPI002243638C|nr:hypothetical protein [Photobacterium obscurum]MCW8332102.1 hypothetical protein [Photobacterium obscurum]